MNPVVIVAPNSFARLTDTPGGMASTFQLMTRSGHFATLPNLWKLANARPGRSPMLTSGRETVNPMAGYYLESFLKQRGYAARCVFDWDTDEALIDALDPEPLAVLFSTTFVTHRALLEQCLAAVQRVTGDLPLIVGGPLVWKQRIELERYTSATPEQAIPRRDRKDRLGGDALVAGLQRFGVDVHEDALFTKQPTGALQRAIYVASEFGEHTVLRVLDQIKRGHKTFDDFLHIPNLVLPTAEQTWHATAHEPEPVDLAEDFTDWRVIDEMPPIVPIRTSVGCPYRCRFCDFIELHQSVVMRSPESILREIQLAKSRGRRFVNFVDDNIFLSRKRVRGLCRALSEGNAGVLWGGFFRVDRVDEENIAALKDSGCSFGLCGIESGDEGILGLMRKGCNQEEIHRGIELCSAAGIHLSLTFILGFPGETQETIDNTIRFINSLSGEAKAAPAYQLYPFYVLGTTAADDPTFRELKDLRGRGIDWSHDTMDYEEVVSRWAPYAFKRIDSIPYEYFVLEAVPSVTREQSVQAFRARKELTCGFMDGASDGSLQGHFDTLFRSLERSEEQPVPHWSSVLAAREQQPKPSTRAASPFSSD